MTENTGPKWVTAATPGELNQIANEHGFGRGERSLLNLMRAVERRCGVEGGETYPCEKRHREIHEEIPGHMTDSQIIDFIERNNLTVCKADGAADHTNTVIAQFFDAKGSELVISAPSVRQAVEEMAKSMQDAPPA